MELTIINEGESIVLQTKIDNEKKEILRIFENRPKTRILCQTHNDQDFLTGILGSTHHEYKSLPLKEIEIIRERYSDNIPDLDNTHQLAKLALFHWKTIVPPEPLAGDFLHELAVGLDENEE
ncbi:MAG: hypothetical protein ACYC9S_02995 [Leptospirales bacterium]